jgi:hypothetical protein
MSGKFAGLGHGRSSPEKLRDVGVTTGRMKIGIPLGRRVRDSHPLQIPFDHQPGSAFCQLWKQQLVRIHSGQPNPQHRH